jgi:hypothetical protein
MNRIFVTSAITFVVSLGQILGQTTSTTTQSQNRDGRTETYTRTETVQPDGRTITTTTHTSTVNMDASFGVKANANMSNFVIRDMDGYQSNMGLGMSAGVFLKLESRNFALQYELLLHYKTSEMENKAGQTPTDYRFWALELPIYFMGQINTGAGKFFIGAGPYVSVGLDAVQNPGNSDLYKKDPTTGKSIMQRWDFGLGAIIGYEFGNGISINGGYQAGFINSLSAKKDNMTMKKQTVSLGIGYKF